MAKNTNKNIVMSGNAISAENVIVAETVTMNENKTKDDKKNRGITILVALIGAAATIVATFITVFYEKPRPFLPNASLDASILALVREDYPEAIAKADEAMAAEPKDPRPYLVKYTAQELSGNHEEAVQTLREGTENVKKRATGGKEIRTVLAAAEVSQEEGLAAVVDVFRSEIFNLKALALRLLEVLVEVFEGTERFARALAEVESELAAEVNTEDAGRQGDEATTQPVEMPENVFGMKEFQAIGIDLDTDIYAIADRLGVPRNQVYQSFSDYTAIEQDRRPDLYICRDDFDGGNQYSFDAPKADPNYHLNSMPAGWVVLPKEGQPVISLFVYSYYSGSYSTIMFDLLPGIGIGTRAEEIVRKFYYAEDSVVFENGVPIAEPHSGMELYRFPLPNDRGYATGGIWRDSDGEKYSLSYSYTDEKNQEYKVSFDFRNGVVADIHYSVDAR